MTKRIKYFFPKGVKIKNTRLTPVRVLSVQRGSKCTTVLELRCDCGKMTLQQPNIIGSGRVKSCGCLKSELAATRERTHGLSKTPEYAAAYHAFERCYDKDCPMYPNYGGRGIQCDFKTTGDMTEWLVRHLPKPKGRFMLDRTNNDGNYSTGNLRWVDSKTSARNHRGNHPIMIGGTTKLLCEWSEQTGIHAMTIFWRKKHGFPDDLILYNGKITQQMLWQREYSQQ